jgi:hypothetical protein
MSGLKTILTKETGLIFVQLSRFCTITFPVITNF